MDFLAYLFEFVGKGFIRAMPLVILTVPVSLWLKKSGLAKRWIPAMRAKPLVAILVAAAAGAVSPLCSCGVIPVIAGLLRAGTPLGPIMAFWIASPSMDPEIFALSTTYLGLPLAIARLVATGMASVAAGFAAHAMEKAGLFGDDYLRGGARRGPAPRFVPSAAPSFAAAPARTSAHTPAAPVRPEAAADASAPPARATDFGAKFAAMARESLPEIIRLSAVMLLAFTLEAVVIRFVPVNLVAPILGKGSIFAVPLATLIGVPLYATNLAALGLVSGLIAKGMSEGAALAFLFGGAATTLPAMTAVWSLAKPRVFALYLGTIIVSALASGWLWDLTVKLLSI
ncbi:MAG TPA: permease [Rectinemataceae bacterium]|nr:permease [Rectinemataceae bacterium]